MIYRLYAFLALMAFAANSILCRLALKTLAIDAVSFTAVRLFSGVIALTLIMLVSKQFQPISLKCRENWYRGLMLFIYALGFSVAYVQLETGSGALILFGCVQITMIGAALSKGQHLSFLQWVGLLMAFSGLIYLVSPTLRLPAFSGFIWMSVAGIAWGFYSLFGRGSKKPLADTGHNFFIALLLFLPVGLLFIAFPNLPVFQAISFQLDTEGIILASLSGAIASGLGYTLWYKAVKGFSDTQNAVMQLLVPIFAALGGVLFVAESLSLRLILSAIFVLGGVALVLTRAKAP